MNVLFKHGSEIAWTWFSILLQPGDMFFFCFLSQSQNLIVTRDLCVCVCADMYVFQCKDFTFRINMILYSVFKVYTYHVIYKKNSEVLHTVMITEFDFIHFYEFIRDFSFVLAMATVCIVRIWPVFWFLLNFSKLILFIWFDLNSLCIELTNTQ